MIKYTCWLAMLIAFSNMTSADTLMVDVIKEAPANNDSGLLRPKIGSTQRRVKEQFGEPISTTPEVGYPPISAWQYDAFTVYFEFEYVITSVVHRE